MIKQITSATKVITLALVLSFGLSYVYAWTAPTATPPGGNVSAPINTSGAAQTKTGKLTVNDVIAGNSFQDTEDASYLVDPFNQSLFVNLGVTGNFRLPNGAGTGKVLMSSDDLGNVAWTDASAGSGLPPIIAGSQEFPSSGIFTPPPGVTSVKVSIIGAGGAGGNGNSDGAYCGGGGGGAGEFKIVDVNVTPGVGIPVTLGLGVLGGTGQASTFGGLVSSAGGSLGSNGTAAVFGVNCTGGAGGVNYTAGNQGASNGSTTVVPSTGGEGGKNTSVQGTYGDGGIGGYGPSNNLRTPTKGNNGYVRVEWGDIGKVLTVDTAGNANWASPSSGGFCVFKRTNYACPSWAPTQEGLQTIGFFTNLDDSRTGDAGHGYNITVCCAP